MECVDKTLHIKIKRDKCINCKHSYKSNFNYDVTLYEHDKKPIDDTNNFLRLCLFQKSTLTFDIKYLNLNINECTCKFIIIYKFLLNYIIIELENKKNKNHLIIKHEFKNLDFNEYILGGNILDKNGLEILEAKISIKNNIDYLNKTDIDYYVRFTENDNPDGDKQIEGKRLREDDVEMNSRVAKRVRTSGIKKANENSYIYSMISKDFIDDFIHKIDDSKYNVEYMLFKINSKINLYNGKHRFEEIYETESLIKELKTIIFMKNDKYTWYYIYISYTKIFTGVVYSKGWWFNRYEIERNLFHDNLYKYQEDDFGNKMDIEDSKYVLKFKNKQIQDIKRSNKENEKLMRIMHKEDLKNKDKDIKNKDMEMNEFRKFHREEINNRDNKINYIKNQYEKNLYSIRKDYKKQLENKDKTNEQIRKEYENELSSTIKGHEKKLSSIRKVHDKELSSIRKDYEKELSSIRKDYEKQLENKEKTNEQIIIEYENELSSTIKGHEKKLSSIRKDQERELKDKEKELNVIIKEYKKQLNNKNKGHSEILAKITSIRKEHEKTIHNIRKEHDKAIKNIEKHYEKELSSIRKEHDKAIKNKDKTREQIRKEYENELSSTIKGHEKKLSSIRKVQERELKDKEKELNLIIKNKDKENKKITKQNKMLKNIGSSEINNKRTRRKRKR